VWVHGVIRRDLETVRRLAVAVGDGLSPQGLRDQLEELQTNGPLWQLKVNCLRYCRFVHMHHGAEDALLFPRLRSANPGLAPVVDRLEADHRRVSDLLDDVERAAAALADADRVETRDRVALALDVLTEHLLEHLDFEEQNAGPTLRRLAYL
jgi:hemerythrin superfamily protein